MSAADGPANRHDRPAAPAALAAPSERGTVIRYYMDEAALSLPALSIVDRSVHEMAVVTPEGARLHFAVMRRPLAAGEAVADRLGALLAEKERALRGFTLIALEERRYPELSGLAAQLRYRGDPEIVYQHQFHAAVSMGAESTWLAFHAEAALADAEACDRWMVEVLSNLRLRGG
jgi:hypothetical protein